ncbi:conserved exported hypothetical protein [Candidatus Desulfarcum epimagneticum]|uniref:DUF481 domain-containing protein n=1 Tax=uncultured Desulfobacteraceae bacterium TaxID=218296 RepID=A0A484HD65_9BACT|nr:conserved exported hypothetical protein [uncultured Desulfobacteraceae bacterium]
MKKTAKRVIFSLILVLSVASFSFAGNSGDLGKWWLKNPLEYDPMPDRLLHHFEGSYSYGGTSGNVEVTSHTGKANLTLRKNILTSVTVYSVKYNDTENALRGSESHLNDQFFRQGFRFALTDKLEAVVGGEWKKNASMYLENRLVYYGGFRFSAIRSENVKIFLAGFYSNTNTEYMNSKIQNIRTYASFPSVDEYESGGLFLRQTLNWKITDAITLNEACSYLNFLDNSDYYTLDLNLSLNFMITKSVSFLVSYDMTYEQNSFIKSLGDYLDERRAAGRFAGEIENRDSKIGVGIQISF